MTTKDQSKPKTLLHTALCVIIQNIIKLGLKVRTQSFISTQLIHMVPHVSLFSTSAMSSSISPKIYLYVNGKFMQPYIYSPWTIKGLVHPTKKIILFLITQPYVFHPHVFTLIQTSKAFVQLQNTKIKEMKF